MGAQAGPAGPIQQVASRPLVGVLAAPGFGPGGSVFAVRQGKNVIGSDRASDICLSADPRVSLEHALLLHRGSAFYLADRMSTNGTWVNDVEVPANGTVVLRDRDRIRCGEVDLIFFIIERAAEGVVDASAE
jgi:pSer/pThr/pTyr-binding forkhead associated (FHA) protein